MFPHVVHIINGLGRGGAELALLRLVQDTSPALRHTVISLTDIDRLRPNFEAIPRVRVQVIGARRGRPDPRVLLRCRRAVRNLAPDMLHAWLPVGWLAGLASSVLTVGRSLPMIWSVRSTVAGFDMRASERIALRVCRAMSNRCSMLIANSHVALRQLTELGFRPRGCCVIYNGVDPIPATAIQSVRQAVRCELGVTEGVPVVAFLGRLHPDKGIDLLLHVWERLRLYRPDAQLWRIGRNAAAQDRTSSIRALESDSAVHHIGEVSDPQRYLVAADALIVTSVRESCPNAVLEAMAVGLPVVTTDVGDVQLLLGGLGKVLGADADGMAAALDGYLRLSGDERTSLGSILRSRIAEHHDPGTVANRYLSIYMDLLNSGCAEPVAGLKHDGT
jgi:glycosyltransferase involved in cell wall biosynthesis